MKFYIDELIILFCFVYRSGTVPLPEYMTFMISRETENVSSIEDVVLAFKSLTENSERPYITRDELYAVSIFLNFHFINPIGMF
jgi:hypothetical protein